MEIISTAIEGTADLGMILGPCLGYIMQTMTMVQEQEADGFSPFVSFILIVANLIRIFWWYSERFSLVILVAAIIMVICQVTLLYYWVKIQNSPKRGQSSRQDFQEGFWHWRTFQNYLNTLFGLIIGLIVVTLIGCGHTWFDVTMGTLSAFVEALLGVPQFYLNCNRGHTTGLAVSLIGMWFFGDLYKMSYYQSTGSPLQLVLCSFFQCATDCAILSQFWIYRVKNAEMQAKVKAADKAHAEEKKGKALNSTDPFFSSTVASSVSTEREDGNSIELDSYKDQKRTPLSPHILTIEETKQSAASSFRPSVSKMRANNESLTLSPLNKGNVSPDERSGDVSTFYDASTNSSILGFVQHDDPDEDSQPSQLLSLAGREVNSPVKPTSIKNAIELQEKSSTPAVEKIGTTIYER